MRHFLVVLVSVAALADPAAAQTAEVSTHAALIETLERTVLTGDSAAYVALTAATADKDAAETFARENLHPGVDRATVTPRFRVPLEDLPDDAGYVLTVDVFSESGTRGRLETWQLEIVREEGNAVWRIRDQTQVDSIESLRHLSVTPTKQYAADNMAVLGEDLSLRLTGSVFVIETETGVTGLVLLGQGTMSFAPQPEAERGQIRIFSGDDVLETPFEAAFIRVHPESFNSRVSTSGLVEQPVDPDALQEARDVFDEFIGQSFTLDLSEISDRLWSLSPGIGDFLAEIRTRRHGTLTYSQSGLQPEDISLQKRETSKIISLYSSARKRATQGRYFADDEAVPVDVLDYDISASFRPLGTSQQSLRAEPTLLGCQIVGTTRLALRVKGLPITAFSLRLADELEVTSVTSAEFGPLLFFRLNGQNNIFISLPSEVPGGTEFTVSVRYAGNLPAQQLDEDWIASRFFVAEAAAGLFGVSVPRYVYSSRSHWYPQSLFTDYATATLELTVPSEWGVIASGSPLATNPPVAGSPENGARRFAFAALQPARYLSALISRFEHHASPPRQVRLPDDVTRPSVPQADGAVFYDTLAIDAQGGARGISELDTITSQTADIAAFYASLLDDIPYPSLTVALTDSRLPGGHSPAYFAVMNHELPRPPGVYVSWKTDPVSFSNYPAFFLAHEVAHQWWGQAVGWKNYHEQWLSEGLAQYFAALYAERDSGPDAFTDILRQMRRWAMRHSDEGPIYLGYRLGHLNNEARVYRALVYNKGAMVLHMLRGLVGDDAFFAGLRRFYHQWRFRRAGTDALQLAFEIESGQSLGRFFDRWIHDSALPALTFAWHTETSATGEKTVLRFEQQTEELFDLPVTVDLTYRSGEEEKVIVLVKDRVTEVRVPAQGRMRRVRVNRDGAALATIDG